MGSACGMFAVLRFIGFFPFVTLAISLCGVRTAAAANAHTHTGRKTHTHAHTHSLTHPLPMESSNTTHSPTNHITPAASMEIDDR